jgi:tetratricopeptide (TPR) repeat protein
MDQKVTVWEEDILLPTYGVGKPEKNPMFLEKRVYQGSAGVVYPYPVIEKIEDTCADQSYHAVYIENEYLKIMILPELGGRVQMAYDKIKERHFIYYNQVIKPALVGLTGPWISGGIEFNWPQHHRPSTFMPIDFTIETLPDGGVTVWVNEQERMFHQKGMAGFTLRPGKAVLEIQGKLFNPTPVPQTFLWWANPAVCVNEHYQSVFPADVNAVFDHGKRDVSKYPIATGTYYKMDYSAGVDISRYENIPVPTSYMAIQSKYNFVGGYENDTEAGVLHVANHHISPGKKQWTWGNCDFGQAWDRNLTDEDGPYIELMTGVYTDNQPDFTWLQPYEEKTFTQYFMPYRELGVVKNACAELLMNIELEGSQSVMKLFATSLQKELRIQVKQFGQVVYEAIETISPEAVFETIVPITSLDQVDIQIFRSTGKRLLDWQPESTEIKEVPDAAKPALLPSEVSSTEQLYLTGLHLEQYRHATYMPNDYYAEALRREPSDVRNNNAMGLWLMRKGQFESAEQYLRTAVATLTERNPNPYDGEPLYNLGLCLKYQDRLDEAYDSFYKACWNAAWQDAGYYSLAQISSSKEQWMDALEEVDKSLIRNGHNHRARHLKSLILRQLDCSQQALALIEESLQIDAFNFGSLFERYLNTQDVADLQHFNHLMRGETHNYEELALDYTAAGCWTEALQVLDVAIEYAAEPSAMVYYYKAWVLQHLNRATEAVAVIEIGEKQSQACFPNRLESMIALQAISALHTHTPKALYYLGNIWYDRRQYTEAVEAWKRSIAQDRTFPTVLRNLSLAYFNKYNREEEALTLLEEAFALDTTDARVLMELDQLYKRLNKPHTARLALLETHKEVTYSRDDLYLEYITLHNQLKRYNEAIALIDARQFHPWEGGEGKVTAQYQIARVELVKELIANKAYPEALALIEACFVYPHNLGEGKLYGAQENDFNYYKGCILEQIGKQSEANACFEAASKGLSQPAAAMYYNDQKPDKIFYQGLALHKLGREAEARGRFNNLISYGEKHVYDTFKLDYFAVSLPDLQIWEDDMDKKNAIHCNYLMGLGYLGLGEIAKANLYLNKGATLDNNHQGIQIQL